MKKREKKVKTTRAKKTTLSNTSVEQKEQKDPTWKYLKKSENEDNQVFEDDHESLRQPQEDVKTTLEKKTTIETTPKTKIV